MSTCCPGDTVEGVQPVGVFPALDEVRAEVVAYIRRDLRWSAGIAPVYASTRTAERHRSLIRVRVEAVVVGSRVGEFKDGHELVVPEPSDCGAADLDCHSGGVDKS